MTNKTDILKEAAAHRASEVFHHQINIDNYRLAISEIESNHADAPHMQEFARRLRELLKSSIEEQDKERVMLKVITMQLETV